MLLAGLVQGAAVLLVVATLAPRLGSAVAIVSGAVGLLLTRPLQRRLEQWLRVQLGDPEARRAALVRRLADEPLAGVAASVLRLRYAAVDVELDGRTVRVSESGVAEPVTTVPVEHRGARVGSLLLGGPLRPKHEARAGELAELAAQALAAHRLRLAIEAKNARLGRELHDRVGPALAGLKMMIHAGALSGPELAGQAAEVAQEVRRVLAELGPVTHGGLVAAVETIAARLTAGGGPVVTVESSGDLDALDEHVAGALYAIAVEALNNAVRHAGARTCRVRLEAADRTRLVVEDDGTGIGPDAVAGLGSASMRRRAREIGGELSVTSVAGTRVEAVV
jgi:signal transduction histidine kinase